LLEAVGELRQLLVMRALMRRERARLLLVAPAERPPVRSVFLSKDPYEFSEAVAEDAG
jgi:hypothetical protein